MQADPQYGGAGIRDFRYEQILLEENLRYGDSGLYFTLHSRLVAPYIEGLGTEEQKRRFLPRCASGEIILGIAMTEPGTGSDLAGIKTRAEDRGDHFILNGAKTYISNGINGDLFVVAARTGPGRQLGLFLVERDMPGFARGRNLKKMGLNSQVSAELFFENVRVPEAYVLGVPESVFF
jgi:alkylation response protein AidB-like acyl-CoA dehydrogenase